MIECLEIILDARSKEVWRNRLMKEEEMWINKLAKIESGYNPRRPWTWKTSRSWDDGMFCVGPVSVTWKKNKEKAKMIKCFELALYQSQESWMKKKWLTEDLYLLPCVYLSHLWPSPSLHYFIYFIIKKKKKRRRLYFYTSALLSVYPNIQHYFEATVWYFNH